MIAIATAAAELVTALKTVEGLRVYSDQGADLDPPCALLGPPQLDWTRYNDSGPSSATFIVLVAVKADDRAVERLWDLVPAVAKAVETLPGAAVRQAFPVSLATGQTTQLPAYQLQVEVSL